MIYYILLDEGDQAAKVDNLLASLGQFATLRVRPVVEVSTDDPALEPLLSKVADHVRPVLSGVAPLKVKASNGHKPAPTRKPRLYKTEDGREFSGRELEQALKDHTIDNGTKLHHSAGVSVVVSGPEGLELHPHFGENHA
jgi:hypothetical protein